MILYAFRRWLLAAVISLLATAGAQANQFTVVRDGETLIALERNLVVAKYNEATGEAVTDYERILAVQDSIRELNMKALNS